MYLVIRERSFINRIAGGIQILKFIAQRCWFKNFCFAGKAEEEIQSLHLRTFKNVYIVIFNTSVNRAMYNRIFVALDTLRG